MGIYLNPGFTNFKETLAAPIYVDKTMMLAEMNRFIDTDRKYVCVSRPRRFGKTIASNMLCAYYSKGCDSRELFAPFKIASDASFIEKINRYNVIKIDVNSEYQTATNKNDTIKILTREIRHEMERAFPMISFSEEDSLARCILRIYSETGGTFILILDEYDVLVRENANDALFAEYLGFLNGLFKSDTLRPAISLAYLTGILPIVRDKVQSKLNNFEEYTVLDAYELAEFVGFTSQEVEELCLSYGVDFSECRRWYDGYSQRGYEIYNPRSVVQSIRYNEFENYWSKTSSYEVITNYIRMNFDGTIDDVIRLIAGESVDVNAMHFLNTMNAFTAKDDVFTYLIHVGYLAYNRKEKTCRIPNKEIRGEWQAAISIDSNYAVTNQIIAGSKALLAATINGNADTVAAALDTSHIHVTSNRSYNNEDALQSAIYLAYIYALNEYTVIKEMTTGRGFVDVIYIPVYANKPALIIELKRNGSADSAIDQIRNRQYFASLAHYQGDLLFVGINYDEKEKTHSCRIERFEKE